jgi:DNA (cytosine-5)-methyltransferase 1
LDELPDRPDGFQGYGGEYLKFIDFFAGIGGFRRGMELAGHTCAGFCEQDEFAAASYTSMHLITEGQRGKLSEMPFRKRRKEILKEEYRNGEWYAGDIRKVDARSLPSAECWCFGAPCQDFSTAGKRKGLRGDRSILVREIFRLLEEQKEESRPEWLIYENVKGMFSSNRGLDYLSILSELDRLGYDIEWQNINSAWFVPQNRERIYTIGHLRRRGARKILPVNGTDEENNVLQLGNYLPTSKRENPNQGRIYDIDGISPCLNKMDGGGREPSVALKCFIDMNYGAGIKITEKARAIQSRYNKGISNRVGETSGVGVLFHEDILPAGKNYNQKNTVHFAGGISGTLVSNGHSGNEPKIAASVLTPERAEKRQNGRRFKENGEPMFTLTGQDRHGVAVSVPTSVENPGNGIYVQLPGDLTVYAVWYEKYQCYIAVRKLTPKECFRLQGWEDVYFERAAFVNSDSQLYKQAGNGVTVPVVRAVAEKL